MTRRWMLQSQASLLWIRIPASNMNFNDSFVNFLDMHHLTLSACQVINQRPTLLIRSPVLTSALSHSMAMVWRLSTRPMGQRTIQTSCEHPVAPSMAEHLRSTCPPHKQGVTCTRTHQQYHRHTQGSRSIFDLSNPSSTSSAPMLAPLVMHNFTFPLQFSLKTWHYREHGAISKFAVTNILTRKEKWNLITPDYAV